MDKYFNLAHMKMYFQKYQLFLLFVSLSRSATNSYIKYAIRANEKCTVSYTPFPAKYQFKQYFCYSELIIPKGPLYINQREIYILYHCLVLCGLCGSEGLRDLVYSIEFY